MPILSLIIPVLDEEEAIPIFMEKVEAREPEIIRELGNGSSLEFVFVNDGSSDRTADKIEACIARRSGVRLINLSRNFGKEAAMSAGLRFAAGDLVIPIDVDLQDPPSLIPEMVRLWKSGAHVVNAKRRDRKDDSWAKRGTSRLFYSLLGSMSEQPVHENVGDFRLFDRKAVNALNSLSESSRFNKGLFSWIGYNVATLEYDRPARVAGTTRWNWFKLWGLAVDGITSSTTLPLRIWVYLGATIAIGSFLYALFLVLYTLFSGVDTPGYASVMVAVLMLGGLNLLTLGLLGEYVGRIAIEVRRRPLFIVESTKGF